MRWSADIRPSKSTCAVVGLKWKSVTRGDPVQNMPNRHSDSEEPGSTVVWSSIVGVFSIAFINNSRLDEGERWRWGCVGIRSSGEGVGLKGGKMEGVLAI